MEILVPDTLFGMMNLKFYPVDKARWLDFERLFECRGSPHYCWCMLWRVNENEQSMPGKAGKKASMKQRVDAGIEIGLLAYLDKVPIAWCSIAPRQTYRSLGGDETKEGVWSLSCFFIKRAFRNKGIASQLLQAAITYAKENEAKYLEAYPVDPESPSYRFMGIKPMFEEAGFQFVKKAGTRRYVMLLELS